MEQRDECIDYLLSSAEADLEQLSVTVGADLEEYQGQQIVLVDEDGQPIGKPAAAAQPAPEKRRVHKKLIELRKLFARLQLSSQRSIDTEGITRSFGWEQAVGRVYEQHDIHELMTKLFEVLDHSLSQIRAPPTVLDRLFRGASMVRMMCERCGNFRDRSETCLSFPIAVKSSDNLLDSLQQSLTSAELLDGITCQHCSDLEQKTVKTPHRRCSALQTAPKYLNLCLSRFSFDWQSGRRVRINDRLPFPTEIGVSLFPLDF